MNAGVTTLVTIFKLKCPVCGDKYEKPEYECRGDDAPTCNKCYGIPMMLDEVVTKKVKK